MYSGEEMNLVKGADTTIHNHPHDATFSNDDISFQQDIDNREAVLITPNYKYTLTRTPESKRIPSIDNDKLSDIYGTAKNDFYWANNRMPTDSEKIDIWRPIRENQLQGIAANYGWKYSKETK